MYIVEASQAHASHLASIKSAALAAAGCDDGGGLAQLAWRSLLLLLLLELCVVVPENPPERVK